MSDLGMANLPAHLMDVIYEAGAIPELWPKALEQVAYGVGAAGGNLICRSGQDFAMRSSPGVVEITRDFAEAGFNENNSRLTRLLQNAHHHGFLTDCDLHEPREFETIPLYRDFLVPRGAAAGAATIVPGASDDALIIAFEAFADHPTSRAAVPALNSLRPHLARASVLSGRIFQSRMDSVMGAFNSIDTSIAILDARGRMLRASDRFESVMPYYMTDTRERLRLFDPMADIRFADRLAKVAGVPAGQSLAVRGHDGRTAVLHLVPAMRQALDLFDRVAIFAVLAEAREGQLPTTDVLSALFDLTPAEARVVRGIAEGKAPAALAQQFGLSPETVRTHLKRAMHKTSTCRQSELSALIGRLR